MEDLHSFLLLLPSEETEPKINVIRCKIRKTYETDVKVSEFRTEVDAKKEDNVRYNEFMIKADINFGPISENQIRKEDILQRFCQENVMSGIGESWLNVLSLFEVQDIIHKNKPILNGFSLGSLVYMNTFVEHYSSTWSEKDPDCRITQVNVHFKHDIRKIEVNFVVAKQKTRLQTLKSHPVHMLELNYNMILRVLIEVQKQPNRKANVCGIKFLRLFLQMNGAPLVHVREVVDDEESSPDVNFKNDDKTKNHFMPSKIGNNHYNSYQNGHNDGKVGFYKQCKKEEQNNSQSYISANLVDDKMMYRRVAEFGNANTKAHCSSKMLGMSRILRLDLQSSKDNENEVWQTVSQLICCCPEAQVYFTSMKTETCLKEYDNPSIDSSNFDCLYALKTITSPSFSMADEIKLKYNLKDVNQKLKDYASRNSKALEKTLFEIQDKYDRGDPIRFMNALEALFKQNENYYKSIKSSKSLPPNMVELRRAVLTPTKLVYLPPIVHMKSYLLRHTDPQFALRISIRDDNFGPLTITNKGKKKSKTTFLQTVVSERLLKGVKIGNRQYEFFGSSTSQLREHGCLFYARDLNGNTAASLRDNLGDFTEIRSVSKLIARMGQSLSQAMANCTLSQKHVTKIDDIERNGYTFSDGVGQMSQEVLEMCHKALELGDDDYKPCALQIRYAGCKGMIVLNPELEGKQLILRKSMWKFDSGNNSLEILKSNFPQSAFLNRPFVTILEQMGVPKKVFFDLQSKHLNRIVNSLYNSQDAQLLLHEEALLRLPFKRLHSCGIDLALEPFFRPMIMAIYNQTVEVLKKKCRVKLPLSHARTMFGVLDETNTLEYEEVFVQYTNGYDEEGKPSKETTILEGEVLITKNPCMHPGDVQKFQAVSVDGLKHIKDCLVFSQRGNRPRPDEMAGSDLDGDEYCVVWYKPLIFGRNSHEPMNYNFNLKAREKDNIEVKDMVDFIAEYIRDDCVGLVANAHLAWADTKGIFDERCLELAKKYSLTLDFPKTGQPANLSKGERVHLYPDFMEKFREKDSYLSTKALGHLYRNCKHVEMLASVLSTQVPVEIDPLLEYEGWMEYQEDATRSLHQFIYLFSSPTRLYKLTNEGEIMAGAIKKLDTSFQGKNIEKNIAKMLESLIPHVMRKMRDSFYEEFLKHPLAQDITRGSENKEQALQMLQNNIFGRFKIASMEVDITVCSLLNEMLKKASAWYMVAYKSKQDGVTLYLGLPWVVSELMGLLRSRSQKQKDLPLQKKIKAFLESEKKSLDPLIGHISSEQTVQISKLIMMKWLEESDKFMRFRKIEMKRMKEHIKEMANLGIDTVPLSTEELVYKFLTTIVRFYTQVQFDENSPGAGMGEAFWIKKELGLLAIVTLSSLSCNGKLWISDVQSHEQYSGLSFLNKDFREEIRYPLDLGRRRVIATDVDGRPILGRSEFGEAMLQYGTDIADFLKSKSRVKMVKIEFKEDKFGGKWFVLLSIYGKVFNIEYLKDFIVQPSFQNVILQEVKRFSIVE